VSTYDHYDPGTIECPECGEALVNWTGSDGPGRFFLYRLGVRQPVDQLVDEDSRTPMADWPTFPLPRVFVIEAWDTKEPRHRASATGICDTDGRWARTWLHHGSWSGCSPSRTAV
jgi:hypothetical protein